MIVLSATNITKEYGTDVILRDVSFHLNEGDRVGLIGKNGEGKTTLLKILTGELAATAGESYISKEKTVGYLKQTDHFDSRNTVIAEVEQIFTEVRKLEADMTALSETIAEKSARREDVDKLLAEYDRMTLRFEQLDGYSYKSEIVGILSSMAFTEEFYDKKISMLSGGERTRLALACLLLKSGYLVFGRAHKPPRHRHPEMARAVFARLQGYDLGRFA